jgi:hypothetical protein
MPRIQWIADEKRLDADFADQVFWRFDALAGVDEHEVWRKRRCKNTEWP